MTTHPETQLKITPNKREFNFDFVESSTKGDATPIERKTQFDDFITSLTMKPEIRTFADFIKKNSSTLTGRYSKEEIEKVGYVDPIKALGLFLINEWFRNELEKGNKKLIAKDFFTYFNIRQDSIRFLNEISDNYKKEYSFNEKTKQYDIFTTDVKSQENGNHNEYEYLRVPLLKYYMEQEIKNNKIVTKENNLKDETPYFITSISVNREDYKTVQLIAKSVEKYMTISYLFSLLIQNFADILLVLIESPQEISNLAKNLRKKTSQN